MDVEWSNQIRKEARQLYTKFVVSQLDQEEATKAVHLMGQLLLQNDELRTNVVEAAKELVDKLGLSQEEVEEFTDILDNMNNKPGVLNHPISIIENTISRGGVQYVKVNIFEGSSDADIVAGVFDVCRGFFGVCVQFEVHGTLFMVNSSMNPADVLERVREAKVRVSDASLNEANAPVSPVPEGRHVIEPPQEDQKPFVRWRDAGKYNAPVLEYLATDDVWYPVPLVASED